MSRDQLNHCKLSPFDSQGTLLIKGDNSLMFQTYNRELIKSWYFCILLELILVMTAGLALFLKSTSTSLFTGSTFYQNLNNFHEYLIQHPLKPGGTKDHFRRVKVPGTAPY